MTERTAVYRLFAAEGGLLYIGVSKDFGARWKQHVREKTWWCEVQRQTVDWYPDRDTALAVEKAAIRDEHPKYNIAYTPRHVSTKRTLAQWDTTVPYMGAAEVGRIFRVSRQRVYQITTQPDFPEPADVLAMGKIWYTADVTAWAKEHGREVADS